MGYLCDADFDDRPSDDREAFVYLEHLSRVGLQATPMDQDGDHSYIAIMDYMTEVAAIANELKIPGIKLDMSPDNHLVEYGLFIRRVNYATIQIRTQRAKRRHLTSVAISGIARTTIQFHLEKVKAEVQGAEIPERRKRRLLEKIVEFESELAKPRFDFAKVMAVVALIAAVAHDFEGSIIDAPKFMQSISQIIGSAKEAEDEAVNLLGAPPPIKILEDLRPPGKTTANFDADQDDDVPF